VEALSELADQVRPGDMTVAKPRRLDLRREDRELGHKTDKS
jgi:hypothetical protein